MSSKHLEVNTGSNEPNSKVGQPKNAEEIMLEPKADYSDNLFIGGREHSYNCRCGRKK